MLKRRLQTVLPQSGTATLQPKHPGFYLRLELEKYKVTQQEFSAVLGISYQRLNGILNGLRSVTADTAILLEKALPQVTAIQWLQQQAYYDLSLARSRANPDAALEKRVAEFKAKHVST